MGNPIHLNPANKGKFRRDLHLDPTQPITDSALHKALQSPSRKVRERAQFVVNEKQFKHRT